MKKYLDFILLGEYGKKNIRLVSVLLCCSALLCAWCSCAHGIYGLLVLAMYYYPSPYCAYRMGLESFEKRSWMHKDEAPEYLAEDLLFFAHKEQIKELDTFYFQRAYKTIFLYSFGISCLCVLSFPFFINMFMAAVWCVGMFGLTNSYFILAYDGRIHVKRANDYRPLYGKIGAQVLVLYQSNGVMQHFPTKDVKRILVLGHLKFLEMKGHIFIPCDLSTDLTCLEGVKVKTLKKGRKYKGNMSCLYALLGCCAYAYYIFYCFFKILWSMWSRS